MKPEELAEERRLICELRAMAERVREGIARDDPPEVWRDRRPEISRLRARVRRMRVEHLGH